MTEDLFKGVVHLTTAEYQQLITEGSITDGTHTLVYDRDTIYVTTDNTAEQVAQNTLDISSLDTRVTALQSAGYITSSALSPYALIAETGNKITLEVDGTNYTLTAKLIDKNNNIISTSQPVTLPLDEKEDISNKVTSLSDESTDTEYPSAKAVYDALQEVDVSVDNVTIEKNSDNELQAIGLIDNDTVYTVAQLIESLTIERS